VVHSTAMNSSDNLPSYPPDNHYSSDTNRRRKTTPTKCSKKKMRILRSNIKHEKYKPYSLFQLALLAF